MGRKRTPWLVGLVLATGVASLLLGALALSGFGAAGAGDLAAAGSWSPANLLAVLVGSLFLLGIDGARMASRRTARVARSTSAAKA